MYGTIATGIKSQLNTRAVSSMILTSSFLQLSMSQNSVHRWKVTCFSFRGKTHPKQPPVSSFTLHAFHLWGGTQERNYSVIHKWNGGEDFFSSISKTISSQKRVNESNIKGQHKNRWSVVSLSWDLMDEALYTLLSKSLIIGNKGTSCYHIVFFGNHPGEMTAKTPPLTKTGFRETVWEIFQDLEHCSKSKVTLKELQIVWMQLL